MVYPPSSADDHLHGAEIHGLLLITPLLVLLAVLCWYRGRVGPGNTERPIVLRLETLVPVLTQLRIYVTLVRGPLSLIKQRDGRSVTRSLC